MTRRNISANFSMWQFNYSRHAFDTNVLDPRAWLLQFLALRQTCSEISFPFVVSSARTCNALFHTDVRDWKTTRLGWKTLAGNLWRQGNVHPLALLPFPPCRDVLFCCGMWARNALWDGEFRFPHCRVCYRFFATVTGIKVREARVFMPSRKLVFAFIGTGCGVSTASSIYLTLTKRTTH